MKNIFKMMGVALLACSLIMVSCKKDDDSNSEGNGGLTIKWDGAIQHPMLQEGYQSANYSSLFSIYTINDTVENYYPIIEICFWNSQQYGLLIAGELVFNTQDGDQISGQSAFPTQVFTDGGYVDGNGDQYGEYQWAWCNSENYSTFDATTLTADVNVSMTFYELMQFQAAVQAMGQPTTYEEYQAIVAESDPKDMDLTLKSFAFEAAAK